MKKTAAGLIVPSTYQSNLYTTGKGTKLKLSAIPPYVLQDYRLAFVEQYEAEHPRPEKPTYEVEVLGGGKVLYEHDAKTVKTDEETAALAAYEAYEPALDNFVNAKLLDVMIVEGVDVDPNEDVAWLKKKKFFKVELPEDDIELKLMYVREQLIFSEGNSGDLEALPLAIAKLGGVSDKAVAAGKATFRRGLRQRQNADRPTETEIDGEVVDEPEISGDEDSEGMEPDAEPVGQPGGE